MPHGKKRKNPVTADTIALINAAILALVSAQANLRTCEANNAALAVGRALKSTKGALRHAQLILVTEPTGMPT